MTKEFRQRKAFTLIEVLITLIIIGVLAGTMVFTMSGGRDSAKAVVTVQDLHTLKSATEMHYADTGNWISEDPEWASIYVDNPNLVGSSLEGEDPAKCSVTSLDNGNILATCNVDDSWGGTSGMRERLAGNQALYDLLNQDGDPFGTDDHAVGILIAYGNGTDPGTAIGGDGSEGGTSGTPESGESSSGGGSSSGELPDYPGWDPEKVYVKGDRIIYDGAVYEAHWYSEGDTPAEGGSPWSGGSPWQELTDEWRAFNIYETGDTVVHNGALFEALWENSAETPGQVASDAWQEQTDEWRTYNTYEAGDTVVYNGSTYRAKWYSRNSDPGVGSEWEKLD